MLAGRDSYPLRGVVIIQSFLNEPTFRCVLDVTMRKRTYFCLMNIIVEFRLFYDQVSPRRWTLFDVSRFANLPHSEALQRQK
jgi:hypothetical protein